MKTVYAYFQEVCGWPRPDHLLRLWHETWTKKGWNPVLLAREDIRHVDKAYLDAVNALPAATQLSASRCCYLRHVAMAERGGLFTDYDVMNLTFSPDMLDEVEGDDRDLITLNPAQPSCMWGRRAGFLAFCRAIQKYQPCEKDCFHHLHGVEGDFRPHVSDMVILWRIMNKVDWLGERHFCLEVGDPGCDQSPLVHFGCSTLQRFGLKDVSPVPKALWVEAWLKQHNVL